MLSSKQSIQNEFNDILGNFFVSWHFVWSLFFFYLIGLCWDFWFCILWDLCVDVYCVCVSVFLWIFFFVYVSLFSFSSCWFVSIAGSFSKDEKKEGLEFDGWGGVEDLRGYEGGKTMVRIYCMKKVHFSFLKDSLYFI